MLKLSPSDRETARQWQLLPIAGRMLKRREPFASWISEDSSPSITWPLDSCIVWPPSSEYLHALAMHAVPLG